MRELSPEFSPVLALLASYRSGTFDATRAARLIAQATDIVETHRDDPLLCSSIDPTNFEKGMMVCFQYRNPGVNPPFRLGVVDRWNAGCWLIFTFNLYRDQRVSKGGKTRIVPCGPGFRNYNVTLMTRAREVLAPAARVDPAAAESYAEFGQHVKALFMKHFGKEMT